jgi:hypothetical protein
MGGLIADERRAANKKRILHISLGFIIGLGQRHRLEGRRRIADPGA